MSRNISTVVMTCPRAVNYLPRTMDSLTAAGFLGVLVSNDHAKSGPVPAYRQAIRKAIQFNPGAEFVLVFQDDIRVSSGLLNWIETSNLPEPVGGIGCLSLYCSSMERVSSTAPMWFRKPLQKNPHCQRPWELVYGSLAMLWPRESAEQFLIDSFDDGGETKDDWLIGRWCIHRKKSLWVRYPSYVQHIGNASSLSLLPKPSDGDVPLLPSRMSDCFVGSV